MLLRGYGVFVEKLLGAGYWVLGVGCWGLGAGVVETHGRASLRLLAVPSRYRIVG